MLTSLRQKDRQTQGDREKDVENVERFILGHIHMLISTAQTHRETEKQRETEMVLTLLTGGIHRLCDSKINIVTCCRKYFPMNTNA